MGFQWNVRNNEHVDIHCSVILKSCILTGHGHVMEVMQDGNKHIHVMICLTLIGNSMGPKDYIAIVFPWAKCNEEVCGDLTKEHQIIFNEG